MGCTELSEVEASAGGGGEAGAGGERGVTGRVLQPAGGVGAQPIAGLLVASQLWGRAIPTGSQRKGSSGSEDSKQNRRNVDSVFLQDKLIWILIFQTF